MVKLTSTDSVYRFIMEKNKNKKIKIHDVYNRIFFSTFGLEGVRIYNKDNTLRDSDETTETNVNVSDKKLEDTFGKERNPSGYSDLPLYKKPVKHADGSVTEETDDKSGMYGFLNDYISKYTKSNQLTSNQVTITIPRDVNNPIISLNDITTDKNNYNSISKTGMSYTLLEKIVRDIHLQIEYMSSIGFYYNEIPVETTFLINGRYIVLSIDTIDVLSKSDQGTRVELKDAFLKFLQKLLQDDIKNILDKMQFTDLYYYIKRVQDENVFLLL